jgi:hypothetical protein
MPLKGIGRFHVSAEASDQLTVKFDAPPPFLYLCRHCYNFEQSPTPSESARTEGQDSCVLVSVTLFLFRHLHSESS